MPNTLWFKDKLKAALEQAEVHPGDTVFAHSDITPLITSDAFKWITEGLSVLKESILEYLGDQGTLLIPTFNYEFCHGKPYDHKKSNSQVGAFSNYILRDKQTVRSLHPIYSIGAIGKEAGFFTSGLSRSSFGEGSVFQKMHAKNVKMLFFNTLFYYCTFIHYVEQSVGVDYRFLKRFTGQIRVNGKTYTDTYDFYARYLDQNIVLDLTRLEEALQSNGMMKKALMFGRYPILQTHCDSVFKMAVENLKIDPYFLLKQPPTRTGFK